MFAKCIIVLYASVLSTQTALGQCYGRMTTPVKSCRFGLGFDGLALNSVGRTRAGCGAMIPAPELTASYGGGLPVSSLSSTSPTGLAVTSENIYKGPIAVFGKLPFLGTAAVEGVFATTGAGVISYRCGDGVVAITDESPFEASSVYAPGSLASNAIVPAAMASAISPRNYKSSPGQQCRCGASYRY